MLKTDIALLAPVGLVVLSTARRTDVGLDNIEEGGGRSVSEVRERSFCKHRYWGQSSKELKYSSTAMFIRSF